MAEGNELMSRLMSENADLKKQVRLLKENQMLKRLLSESCQESGSRGSRDLLFPKAPAFPEACSPTAAGEPGEPGSGGCSCRWSRPLLLLRFGCPCCWVSSGEPVSPHPENGVRWLRRLSWDVYQRQAHSTATEAYSGVGVIAGPPGSAACIPLGEQTVPCGVHMAISPTP